MVIGLDLSLTGTGICRLRGAVVDRLATVKPGKRIGIPRMRYILEAITDVQRGEHIDLAVVEGPSYGSAKGQRGHHERAGLWWLVAYGLERADQAYAVAPPRNRAQYATGNGASGKPAVMAAVNQRYGLAVTDDNQGDAATLAYMGADWLGVRVPPVPAHHRKALDKCAWPAVPGEE